MKLKPFTFILFFFNSIIIAFKMHLYCPISISFADSSSENFIFWIIISTCNLSISFLYSLIIVLLTDILFCFLFIFFFPSALLMIFLFSSGSLFLFFFSSDSLTILFFATGLLFFGVDIFWIFAQNIQKYEK